MGSAESEFFRGKVNYCRDCGKRIKTTYIDRCEPCEKKNRKYWNGKFLV